MKNISVLIIFNLILSTISANKILQVGYTVSPPFIIEMQEGQLQGVNVQLWNKIADENSLNFELVNLPLDSLIEKVQNGTIDLALNPLTITEQRSLKMDFTVPFFMSNSGLLIKDEEEKSTLDFIENISPLEFIKSLTALFSVIAIFGTILWYFEKGKNEQFETGLAGLFNGIWWSAVTMTTVGYGDKAPQTGIGKLIATVWMFVAIIIISSFTASISASLTVNDLSQKEDSILDYKRKKIGTVQGSATEGWINDKFFSKMQSFSSLENAIKALDNNEVEAVAYGAPMLKYYEQLNSKQKYKLLNCSFNPQMFCFGLSEQLNESIKEKVEYSLLKHLKTKDWKHLLNQYNLLEENE